MWAQAIPLGVLLGAVFAAGGAWAMLRLVWASNKSQGERLGELEQWRAKHEEYHRTARAVRRELTGAHHLPEGADDGQ